MITALIKKTVLQTECSKADPQLSAGDVLLDIETTGLKSSHCQIFCIGTAIISSDGLEITQRFCFSPEGEKQILTEFLEEAGKAKRLITFNGKRFDLPFIRTRAALYDLDPEQLEIQHIDLYRFCLGLKNLLQLPDLKQITLEHFLGFFREDKLNGRELIRVYQRLCGQLNLATIQSDSSGHSYSEQDLSEEPDFMLLSDHNRDDLLGLFQLTTLFSYDQLLSGDFSIRDCFYTQKDDGKENSLFSIIVETPRPFAASLTRTEEYGNIHLRENRILFEFPVREGMLRHYLADYKNYYYLPDEGRIIYKSLGEFVDQAHRQKATRQNCYVQEEARYLSLPQKSKLDYYRTDYTQKETICRLPSDQEPEENDLRSFLQTFCRLLIH